MKSLGADLMNLSPFASGFRQPAHRSPSSGRRVSDTVTTPRLAEAKSDDRLVRDIAHGEAVDRWVPISANVGRRRRDLLQCSYGRPNPGFEPFDLARRLPSGDIGNDRTYRGFALGFVTLR